MSAAKSQQRNNVLSFNPDKNCVGCGKPGRMDSGFCLSCVEDTHKFEVPSQFDFEDETHLFAPELAEIGQGLIEAFPEDLLALRATNASIDYLWKKGGGLKDGKDVLGRIMQPKGELNFYSKKDYIVWLAADHCFLFNKFMITAVVYHELLHTHYDEREGKAGLKGHDFEGFKREVEVFGYWRNSIKTMAAAFESIRQPELFSKER